jgi:hemolysin activation/secretion protein
MIRILIFFLCISTTQLIADCGQTESEASKTVIAQKLTGIRLIGSYDYLIKEELLLEDLFPQTERVIEGVYIHSVPFLQKYPKFLQQLRDEAINGPLTIKKINELCNKISSFYLEKGQPFVEVLAPAQPVFLGYLQILVAASKVGAVKVEGNHHFSSDSFTSHISCKSGQEIQLPSLLNDLDWLNRNPFRKSEVIFTPGQDPSTTDIILKTTDRRPILFYGGADNTGTKQTGYARFYGGVRYGNLFGMGQLLSYQFTSGTSVSRFQSHAVDYQIPLPWKNYLDFFGGWSQADDNFEHPHMKSKGTSWQISTRYEIPLRHNPKFTQTLLVGADFKRTNNDLAFGGQVIIHHLIDIAQLMLGWDMGGSNEICSWFFSAELYGSPGHFDSNNTTREFRKLQPGAVATYFYTWVNLGSTFNLPKCWHAVTNGTGQYANQNLLPSEQLELGGYFSVRGYPEYSVLVDEGCFFNNELQTPNFSILQFFKKKLKTIDRFHFLAFIDYGWGRIHAPIHGEQKIYNLLGIGPGMRYNVSEYLAMRVDWGFQMLPIRPHHHKSSTVHAGIYFNF